MRLFVISDCHRDMRAAAGILSSDGWRSTLPLSDATGIDVVVLAGDIDRGTKGLVWAGRESDRLGLPVLYVPGNHEFYGYDIDRTREAMRLEAARYPLLHFLDNDEALIDGVRFLGTTLWTDYRAWRGDAEGNMEIARMNIADHHLIHRGGRLFAPREALALHKMAREFLEDRLAQPFDGPTVVVTHHGPSPLCQHPAYPPSPVSAAFQSDLDDLIQRYQPALWIFGHTHAAVDDRVGATRIYSNPEGYPGELIARPEGFDPLEAIEV